jgi:zinc protease
MREIRSNRGLAYSVYSYFSIGRLMPGPFVIGCETKNESTAQVLEIIRQEIEKIASEPVDAAELKLAKESMVNSFVFAFDDQHRVLSRQMLLDYFEYPEDYMVNYRNNIASVTIDDILRVAKSRLKFSEMVTILAGPAQVKEQIGDSIDVEVRIPE